MKHVPWPGSSNLIRKTTLPSSAYERSSPLHAKQVPPLDYDVVLQFAKVSGSDHVVESLLRWNLDGSRYDVCHNDVSVSTISSDITESCIASLQAANIITPVNEQDVLVWGHLFTVYEPAKHRRRLILWPRALNDDIDYVSCFTLPSTRTQVQMTRAMTWAVAFDLSASFYQCRLSKDVQRYFGFKSKNGCFVFTRMVMGFSPAAEIMHAILSVLAQEASRRAAVEGQTTIYIDNVRFGSTSCDAVSRWAVAFKEVCSEARVTLNAEPENAPHQVGIFLGVQYDYAGSLARLTHKTLGKLQAL
eukprot:PhM_4_TR18876/c1_g1_i2/m.48214